MLKENLVGFFFCELLKHKDEQATGRVIYICPHYSSLLPRKRKTSNPYEFMQATKVKMGEKLKGQF